MQPLVIQLLSTPSDIASGPACRFIRIVSQKYVRKDFYINSAEFISSSGFWLKSESGPGLEDGGHGMFVRGGDPSFDNYCLDISGDDWDKLLSRLCDAVREYNNLRELIGVDSPADDMERLNKISTELVY